MSKVAIIFAASATIATLICAQTAIAYQLEMRSKEARSTVYVVKCTDGKSHWIRQEHDGKWCYGGIGGACYSSLPALMSNALSSCR